MAFILDLTNANFDLEIDRHPLMVIDFWASWCAPCTAFAPVFQAASERHSDIQFARINTDEESALSSQFEIRSIPTLFTVRNGEVIDCRIGLVPPQKLEGLLKTLRAKS